MNILFETDSLKFENEFEATFLVEKKTGKVLMKDDFYGDPHCALIDEAGNWAIVAGEHLTIWTPQKWKRLGIEGLKWIHSLRRRAPDKVEILIDPWSEVSAIWEIDTKSFEVIKVREFDTYKNREYTENLEW